VTENAGARDPGGRVPRLFAAVTRALRAGIRAAFRRGNEGARIARPYIAPLRRNTNLQSPFSAMSWKIAPLGLDIGRAIFLLSIVYRLFERVSRSFHSVV
jgi:hypothetical protein